jgi:hypothetical protein
MTPPTPAAVRVALTDEVTILKDVDVLRDHIRAVAQEMRGRAVDLKVGYNEAGCIELRRFADKLEGLK